MIYFSEPNGPETVNGGRLKEMFGGEKQQGRENYGQHTNFKMRATPLLASNHELRTNLRDHGFWRRIKYYRSKVKFCANPDPANPYEQLVDLDFNKTTKNNPEYLKALLSTLVHYNQQFRLKYDCCIDKIPCETIARETAEYRASCDTMHRFLLSMLVVSPDTPEQLSTTKLAHFYNSWYNENVQKNAREADNISSIAKDFVTSAIGKHLTVGEGIEPYLVGFRVRSAAGESLRVGETAFRA